VHASFVAMCQKQKRAAKPEAKQFVEAFETKLNEAHVERAAAYNVSARAEGKDTVIVTEIPEEEEEKEGEDVAENDDTREDGAAIETTEANDDDDRSIVRAESKTSDTIEHDENVPPDAPKVSTPPASPPRRSRRA